MVGPDCLLEDYLCIREPCCGRWMMGEAEVRWISRAF